MITRRSFVASTAAALAAGAVANQIAFAAKAPADSPVATSPSDQPKKLNIGVVGVGGRGGDNLKELLKLDNANVVALCDVDAHTLVGAARIVTSAATFTDFRDLLKHPDIDAVLIATPDHTHAIAAATALRAGKHVYCEKPLTHTIKESRTLADLAEQTRLVTQTGVQNHSISDSYRRTVELIHGGTIGQVSEVHIWHNRTRRPFSEEIAPPPAELNYDLWLGPESMRPFRKGYHPYSWRHWWAFGNGQIGDQSSHFLDLVFWCLGLEHVTKVSAQSVEAVKPEMVCNHLTAQFEFPARNTPLGAQPPVKLSWYDNPLKPADIDKWNLPPLPAHVKGFSLHEEGIMLIGDKGMLCTNYSYRALLPEDKFKDFKPPPQTLGKPGSHQGNWVDACLKNDPSAAVAPLAYGALLAEIPMLATIAFRTGKTLEWDWKNMKFPNAPEAEQLLDYSHREGWTL